jgi:hypothetical protein
VQLRGNLISIDRRQRRDRALAPCGFRIVSAGVLIVGMVQTVSAAKEKPSNFNQLTMNRRESQP